MRNNPKSFWRYVNSKTKTRKTISDLEKDDGKLTTSDQEKAGVLNNFFSSVFTIEDLEDVPDFAQRPVAQGLDEIQFTIEDVEKLLCKLKIAKSPGPDRLHPRILKECASVISPAVYSIFRLSIDKSQLPEDWKIGRVTPIHKKGSRRKACNYRPISLTSVLCKTLEALVRSNVVKHMERNNLYTTKQHGFVSGRSCMTQLLETMEAWTRILDEDGGAVDAIYLDFQKAFDTVPHKRLLTKLRAYNISGTPLNWIADFLHNRRQQVVVNGAESSWTPVTSGIPQGSVLGPVLFVIFINDLPDVVQGFVEMFADDTKLFRSIRTEADCVKMQDDIDSLDEWSRKWQLKFNASKCHHMRLGNRNIPSEYTMKDSSDTSGNTIRPLEKTKLEKDLGINNDEGLNFKQHIDMTAKKANSILGIIRRTFTYLDKDTVLMLYKALIRPRLEYGNIIWNPLAVKDKETIEGVQRRATKLITSLKDLKYEDRLRELKLPTLVFRRLRGDMIEMYKLLTDKYNINTDKLVTPAVYRGTRGNSMKLDKPRSKSRLRQHFFSHRAVNDWNALPDSVVTAPNVNTFKRRLDKLWQNHPKRYDFEFKDPPGCAPPKFRYRDDETTSTQDPRES